MDEGRRKLLRLSCLRKIIIGDNIDDIFGGEWGCRAEATRSQWQGFIFAYRKGGGSCVLALTRDAFNDGQGFRQRRDDERCQRFSVARAAMLPPRVTSSAALSASQQRHGGADQEKSRVDHIWG
ncbi:hypothetical protein V8G54_011004 [Vigna mungo]|uniref:Uncharacterized protein n=1 Tax=Vigna mungo TaxID=3915 RepID=A0AAQ3NQN9_VIGMU